LDTNLENVIDLDKPDIKGPITGYVWGWNCGAGIAGLTLGVIAILVTVVLIASPVARRWRWVGGLVCAGAGIPLLVLSMVWMIASPGDDVEPYISQGMHAGPLVALPGSLILMVCGALSAVFGLKAFKGAAER
jgi:uncharacterized membrane protein YkgB